MSSVKRTFVVLAVVLSLLLTAAVALIYIEINATNLIALNPINKLTLIVNSSNNDRINKKQTLEHGAYLAKVGNCAACHTAKGGATYAGGKAINTPFGRVYSSNITPDAATGIGKWTADAFYRALNEGRSADGHLLTPAFPYPNYTHVSRADSDDLYAYFRLSVAPVVQTNQAHDLAFPFNTQAALAIWRLLFFKQVQEAPDTQVTQLTQVAQITPNPQATQVEPSTQANELLRGAYFVRGLGHCSACHAERNALGASINAQLLGGALMPMQDWYAPSLVDPAEAGVAHLPRQDVVALLKTGIAPNASVLGPMAEVVAGSTQYWTDADLKATAAYLQSLPQIPITLMRSHHIKPSINQTQQVNINQQVNKGEALYTQHCATCHGEQGQGMRLQGSVALPALAGNRAVTMTNTTNLIRIILAGGFAPSTAGNPRPFGMPPFAHVLNDADIAAVTTHIRNTWGNQAPAVSAVEVVHVRKRVE